MFEGIELGFWPVMAIAVVSYVWGVYTGIRHKNKGKKGLYRDDGTLVVYDGYE